MNEITHEEASLLAARLLPGATVTDSQDLNLVTLAEGLGRSVEEVTTELEILRGERRLAELEREREAEHQRLTEAKAAKEAAARARETPEEQDERRSRWLERQQLFYEREHPDDSAPPTPESIRKGWQAIDAADTEKPAKRRTPATTMLIVVGALLGLCLVLQVIGSIGGAGGQRPQVTSPKR